MNQQNIRVRELAGWGLDADEYRPATYRGNPDRALFLINGRPQLENRSALVKSDNCKLRARLQEQASRADLHTEMAGLDWYLDVVDLRLLLAFQRKIILNAQTQESPIPTADDTDGLIDLCFGETKPLVCNAVQTDTAFTLRSANPNLQFRLTDDTSNPIAIYSGSPFFEVAEYRDRWFVRDGYHRAVHCLQAGVCNLPAVVVQARTREELGAARPWFFPEEVLFSPVPPRIIDFLDDELVIEYDRAPLIKTLRIKVEETYSLEGEEQ
jgi:hypothetical protein